MPWNVSLRDFFGGGVVYSLNKTKQNKTKTKNNTMKTTSKNELQAICDRINIITDSPLSPYTKGENGITANLGNYHLSGAYGGWALCRMQTQGGGVSDIFGGHMPKRELAARMHAFIQGIEFTSGK